MKRILFVCLGNICRSPTAEAVFAQKAEGLGFEIDSAGTGGWHVGHPPHPPMSAAAAARGYDLSSLRARQFVAEDFERFDLILTMDASNTENVERLRPAGTRTPVRLFASYAPQFGRDEVPDPYYDGGFDLVLDMVEAASDALIGELTERT